MMKEKLSDLLKIKIGETNDKYLTEYCSYKGEVTNENIDGKAEISLTKQ